MHVHAGVGFHPDEVQQREAPFTSPAVAKEAPRAPMAAAWGAAPKKINEPRAMAAAAARKAPGCPSRVGTRRARAAAARKT